MIVAVTPSNYEHCLIILDTTSGEQTRIPTPDVMASDYRPFGMTWKGADFFIANPRRVVAFRGLGSPRVWLDGLPYGTHQIVWHDRCLWMVSPRTEGVIRWRGGELDHFRVTTSEWSSGAPAEVVDVNHFNSICFAPGECHVMAHNLQRPSHIYRFSYPDMGLVIRHEGVGTNCHCVCPTGGDVVYLDSIGVRLRSLLGLDVKLGEVGEYARGLSVTDDHFVIGMMKASADRSSRNFGDSSVVVVDRADFGLRRYPLERTGSINDLRVLDLYDHAHGVKPYWGRKKLWL